MTLLFIGDVFGKVGRDLVRLAIKRLVDRHAVDLVIANVENCAGGFGITRETAEELFDAGVEVMTSGNHVWDKKEALDYLRARAAHHTAGQLPRRECRVPGRQSCRTRQGDEVGVLNLMGRVFMQAIDDPFATGRREAQRLRARTPIVLVDMHAEATSEKLALGWHLDGQVSRGRRHAYARPDRRRAGAPGRDGLHHRRRDDGPARRGHRCGAGSGDRALPHGTAGALRFGEGPPDVPWRRRHRGSGHGTGGVESTRLRLSKVELEQMA